MKSLDPFSIVIALNHLSDVVATASNVNIFKDYFMPIFVVLLSAGTAYIIALKGYQYQELYKNEKNKAATYNSLILQMQSMHASLITLKQNYFKKINSDPIQRAMNIPYMPLRINTVSLDMGELTQLLLEAESEQEQDEKPWLQMRAFLVTYANFNMVIDMLALRNKLDEEVKSNLNDMVKSSDENGEINIKDLIETVDKVLMMKYVDITESLLRQIDNLIITIDDFFKNFPSYAPNLLKKKYLKGYVYIASYHNETEFYKESLKRCQKVDVSSLAKIMKFDEKMVKAKYLDASSVIATPKS